MNNIVINNKLFPFYIVFIFLSILIGSIYMAINIKKITNNKIVYLYLILFILTSLLFGKFFGYISNYKNTNLFTSGLSSYGGLSGIILSSIIFELIFPLDKKLIKTSIIALPLMYSIGKIGCFLTGCCHGIIYKGLFSIKYIDSTNTYFPIQILETIVFFILFIILNKNKDKKNIIYISLFSCSLAKFILDFLRYEHNIFSLTNIFSILIMVISIILFIGDVVCKKEKK